MKNLRFRPFYGGMPGGRMAHGKQRHIGALVGMGQNVPTFATQHDDGILRSIEMILSDDALHVEPAVDAALLVRFHNVQLLVARLEVGQLIEEVFGASGITFAVRAGIAASDETKVPMRLIGTELVVGDVGVREPFVVLEAHILGGLLPTFGQDGLLEMRLEAEASLGLVGLSGHPI